MGKIAFGYSYTDIISGFEGVAKPNEKFAIGKRLNIKRGFRPITLASMGGQLAGAINQREL